MNNQYVKNHINQKEDDDTNMSNKHIHNTKKTQTKKKN